ncbi:MAG: exopolyphosphatase [Alphaproteobacteria bacterium]|nr:exopolyphosphatase [Alphaproteobacteria bacterium]
MSFTKVRRSVAPRARSALGRVAVIDIGSNSIRLVVFDGLKRAFLPLFNEKAMCGLGLGLRSSGQLSEEGMASAHANLARFVAMAGAMEVSELHMVATAAVREAANGPDFVAEVERRCGHPVRVLSGAEEAHLAAHGVLAGLPGADGMMGDLGGGSLELVALDGGEPGASATLNLGPLNLMDVAKNGPKQALETIESALDKVTWLDAVKGRDFYAVGGGWRNLARLHMEQTGYPLHVLHNYILPRDEAEAFARLVAGLGKRSIAQIQGISRRRAKTLPYAALLLDSLLRRARPARLVVSAYGLREGLIFDRLPARLRRRDPLIEGTAELATVHGRFGDLGEALASWTDPLFPDEAASLRRLRLAACHLSDLAWREHPDYRADQALQRILHYPFMAVDHPGRAFLAVTVSMRYGGNTLAPSIDPALALLPDDEMRRARITGLALRLAYTLSAGVRSILDKTSLEYRDGRLCLELPNNGSIPSGETVENRLQAMVEALEAKSGSILT